MKKILVVDDSALMRRVLCDIIDGDKRFTVADEAINGEDALKLLLENQYDAMVLDVNMPRMDGIRLLKELKLRHIFIRVLVAGTEAADGTPVTETALELGAMKVIDKPDFAFRCGTEEFISCFLTALSDVCGRDATAAMEEQQKDHTDRTEEKKEPSSGPEKHEVPRQTETGKISSHRSGNRIVAIASSTGGPRALQDVVPYLPENLNAPVVMVQHMPIGFTASLASRLNNLGRMKVTEAQEGDVLKKGCAYLSMGGKHMNLVQRGNRTVVHYTDEPAREGVKPCANYMFESLAECDYDEVICVVLTGMGSDGTEGISNLGKEKRTYVITQDQETCVVYGMPKSTVEAGLSDVSLGISEIAQEIILHTGVK